MTLSCSGNTWPLAVAFAYWVIFGAMILGIALVYMWALLWALYIRSRPSLSKNIYIYIHIIHMKTTQQHLRPIWILSSITSAAASTSKLQVDGNLGAG